MKNFGCLASVSFDLTNQKQIERFLFENNLFEYNHKLLQSEVKGGKLDLIIDSQTLVFEPTIEFIFEFSEFISKLNHHKITEGKSLFYLQFDNIVYGLDFKEQKGIALKEFNYIYNQLDLNLMFFKERISENGVHQISNDDRFKNLYNHKSNFSRKMAEEFMGTEYLKGNKEFYQSQEFIERHKLKINEFIQLEIDLQILVSLNDRYSFEIDYYFTNYKYFKKYQHIFKTYLSYQFTDRKILSFETDKKSQIGSLYTTLINFKMIHNHKENFMHYVKNEYDIPMSKIVSFNENDNYIYDERVAIFSEELTNLTSKKV